MKIKICVSLCLLLGTLLSQGAAQAWEAQTDVLVNQSGQWVRAWVLREDGPDHHLVAYNWNADSIQRLPNTQLQLNTRAPFAPQDKEVSGWASTEGTLWSLASSPDGQYLAAGAAAGFIQLFEQQSFYPFKRLPAWGKAVFALAFSADSQYLAACSYEGQLKIFRTQTWQEHASLSIGKGCERLAFASNGQIAIAGSPAQPSGHHALWLYDLKTNKLSAPLLSAPASQRHLSALSFSPNGQYLAVGSSNRQKGLEVFQVTGQTLKSLKKIPTAGDVSTLSFSPNGEFLANSSDQQLQLWKWQSGQRFWAVALREPGTSEYLSSLDFAPNGQQIAACGTGRGAPVKLYRMGNGALQAELGESRSMRCNGLRFSHDGRSLFTIRQVFSNFNEKILDRYRVP